MKGIVLSSENNKSAVLTDEGTVVKISGIYETGKRINIKSVNKSGGILKKVSIILGTAAVLMIFTFCGLYAIGKNSDNDDASVIASSDASDVEENTEESEETSDEEVSEEESEESSEDADSDDPADESSTTEDAASESASGDVPDMPQMENGQGAPTDMPSDNGQQGMGDGQAPDGQAPDGQQPAGQGEAPSN